MTKVDPKARQIVVTDRTSGDAKELQLRQDSRIVGSLRVYREEARDFTEGDQVRFTSADKRLGLINGARGTVDAIGDGAFNVRLSDGRNLDLARDSLALRGMDHAYAATAHDFQGATVNRILIGMSASEQLVSQKSFYVAISRMRDEAVLLTNDASGLARRIEEQTGERPTALESWVKAERDARGQVGKVKDHAREDRTPSADEARTEEALRSGASKEQDIGSLTAKELDLLRSTVGSDRSAEETLTPRQRQKTMEGPVR